MYIPSDKKLELQARDYSKSHHKPKNKELIDKLSKKLSRVRTKWQPFQDACMDYQNSQSPYRGKCICETFPEYQTIYMTELMPLADKINALSREDYLAEESLYKEKLTNLMRGKLAKLKYISNH